MASVDELCDRMRYWCDDGNLGYCQDHRWDIREGGECDCSSLVVHCLQEAGFDTGDASYTGNMSDELCARGWSRVANDGNPRRGDILLNDVHHVAVYIGDGLLCQASRNELHTANGGQPGDQDGWETNTRGYYDYPWDCYLRYEGATDENQPTFVDDEGEGAVYRLYNRYSGLHMFTGTRDEAQQLADRGWTYEGLAWRDGGGEPYWRLYNQYTGAHLLTSSVNEVGACVVAGWTYEGEFGRKGGDVYRLYNGTEHMYTQSADERQALLSAGWADEGVL